MRAVESSKEKAITTKDTKDHEGNATDARQRAQDALATAGQEAGATVLPEYVD